MGLFSLWRESIRLARIERKKYNLFRAIEKKESNRARQLLVQEENIGVNDVVYAKQRLLFIALKHHAWLFASFLLQAGADPKLSFSTDARLVNISILHRCAISGNEKTNSIIKLLMFYDLNDDFISFRGDQGKTMLEYIDARGSKRATLCNYSIEERKRFISEVDRKWKEYRSLVRLGQDRQHPDVSAEKILSEMAENEPEEELKQLYLNKREELLESIPVQEHRMFPPSQDLRHRSSYDCSTEGEGIPLLNVNAP